MARDARDKGRIWLAYRLAHASLWMSLFGIAVNILVVVTVLGVLTEQQRTA